MSAGERTVLWLLGITTSSLLLPHLALVIWVTPSSLLLFFFFLQPFTLPGVGGGVQQLLLLDVHRPELRLLLRPHAHAPRLPHPPGHHPPLHSLQVKWLLLPLVCLLGCLSNSCCPAEELAA